MTSHFIPLSKSRSSFPSPGLKPFVTATNPVNGECSDSGSHVTCTADAGSLKPSTNPTLHSSVTPSTSHPGTASPFGSSCATSRHPQETDIVDESEPEDPEAFSSKRRLHTDDHNDDDDDDDGGNRGMIDDSLRQVTDSMLSMSGRATINRASPQWSSTSNPSNSPESYRSSELKHRSTGQAYLEHDHRPICAPPRRRSSASSSLRISAPVLESDPPSPEQPPEEFSSPDRLKVERPRKMPKNEAYTSSPPASASASASTSSSSFTSSSVQKWVTQEKSCIQLLKTGLAPCHACITRYQKCAFRGVRAFARKPSGQINYSKGVLRPATIDDDELPEFPTTYDRIFGIDEATEIKTAAAHHLLSTLENELAHAQREDCIRIRRELSTRNTCDTCLHVVFCGAFKCMRCARDLCMHCHTQLRDIQTEPNSFERLRAGKLRRAKQISELVARSIELEGNASTARHPLQMERLCRCAPSKETHRYEEFVLYTRIDAIELERIVAEMRQWKASNPLVESSPISQEEVEPLRRSHIYLDETSGLPYLHLEYEQLQDPVRPSDLVDCPDVQDTMHDSFTTFSQDGEETKLYSFSDLWRLKEPIVVDMGIERCELAWDPQHFINQYGSETCNVEGKEGLGQKTVGSFFEKFGKTKPVGSSQKIKDWPPTTDFKSAFPNEFNDFMSILPMASITRRDGVLNIASHAPVNSNPPDLGPKGYFSEVSDDRKGGNGSTKLHMDVADAVNMMYWAGPWSDGAPGAAAWDMFRVDDADTLRDFLYEYFAARDNITVAQARMSINDPIHSQLIFLDVDLRRQLYESKGIKPFRIWQRPGEVVFIPAGCAHQVCNYADCIKIASDFVSVENVASCWHVTDEFRGLTKEAELWRSDVLELKTQLLWAWLSSERLFESEDNEEAIMSV